MLSLLWRNATSEQALYRLLRFLCKNQSALTPLLLLCAKSQSDCGYALINAGMTPPLRYQLFAGSNSPLKNGRASLLLPLYTSRWTSRSQSRPDFRTGFSIASSSFLFRKKSCSAFAVRL